MTNEIVKQDAQEVQAVSGYEAFREQCERVAETMWRYELHDGNVAYAGNVAAALHFLPLPEVIQEPVAWVYVDANMGGGICEKLKWHRPEYKIKPPYSLGGSAVPLYTIPPDAEALRKDNENLNAEVLKLHRELAGEKLRADQGWARYESANRMLMSANVEIMQMKGGAA